jgi:2-polyprenyl-6-methoxyphenol hydroxylase-like FAD-dependent oxidoreductase
LLADYVTRDGDMETLLREYQARRKPRIKIVVENTLKLAAKEIDPSLPDDPGQIMGSTMGAMAQPA